MFLFGCGFTPLYQAANEQVSTQLKETAVTADFEVFKPQDKKLVYLIKTATNELLNYNEQLVEPKYYFNIDDLVVTENVASIERSGEVARYNLNVALRYSLTDLETSKLIATEQISEIAGYDTNNSIYSTHIATQDARERLADLISKQIKRLLINIYSTM